MYEIFEQYHIHLTEEQICQFERYYQLLIEWNEKINLTAITEHQDVIIKHFLDSSLLLTKYSKDLFDNKTIIDIGTGAGFPGIPLAILLPNTSFVLVDSLNKRIDFLKLVIEELNLNHVQVYHGRAEDYGKNNNFRESFNYCVSRAVAGLPLLLEYCSPFIKVGGSLLLYKSKKTDEEVKESANALDILKCNVEEIICLANEDDFERYLVKIQKVDNTPDKYPRKAGKPKKNPL